MSFISRLNQQTSEQDDFYVETPIRKKKILANKLSAIAHSPTYPTSTAQKDNFIFIKIGNLLKKVLLSDILFFGVSGKYAYLKTQVKELVLCASLKNLQDELDEEMFIRIHQSYLVNVRKIDTINTIKNIVIINGEEIPMGRSYKKQFLSKIQHF